MRATWNLSPFALLGALCVRLMVARIKPMSKIFCDVRVGNSDCTLSGEHFKWSYGVGYLIECAYDS